MASEPLPEPDPFTPVCACGRERVHIDDTEHLLCEVCDHPSPPKP